MAKNTILQEVKKRMADMKESKAAQLETIRQKQEEARTQIEAAALGMKQATEEMNVDSYEEAKNRKHKAQTALDMYNGRFKQIQAQEYISEADSDKVINDLLAYEDKLAADFKEATAEPLKQLAKIHKEYLAEVKDTERTITAWQKDIHANYSTRGATMYQDKDTGKWTDRSPGPVPVHTMPYTGCSEAEQLGAYLKKAAQITDEAEG